MAITMEELRKKAQRYDEALEKAKRLYEKGTITESLGYVFPELKESEGERIRKELMDFVVDNTICKDGRREKWIAWLEKQGEKLGQQEVTKISDQEEDFIEIQFGAYDSELIEATYFIPEGYYAVIVGNGVVIKKGEKPTSWSEEDEKMCKETIDWFEKKCFPYALESENPARESIKWLKSLKDKVGCEANCTTKKEWSKEDEDMLDDAIGAVGAADYYTYDDKEEIKNWLKSIKQRIGG